MDHRDANTGGTMANKPRVLIADDEEGIRESLGLILNGPYEVAFARDGEEALAKMTKEQFALVLLDIKMPKLDGVDIIKRLKGNGLPPILVLTAYQSVELAKEAIKLGAKDYLPKPFDREHLLKAVHSLLGDS
jgi:two-component system response regulator HydG